VTQVTRRKDTRNAYKIMTEKPQGKTPLGSPGLQERILLKWFSKKQD